MHMPLYSAQNVHDDLVLLAQPFHQRTVVLRIVIGFATSLAISDHHARDMHRELLKTVSKSVTRVATPFAGAFEHSAVKLRARLRMTSVRTCLGILGGDFHLQPLQQEHEEQVTIGRWASGRTNPGEPRPKAWHHLPAEES